MSRLLINEPPLQVLPSLAVKVGLNEAIVLQQIHYWLERSKTSVNGHLWVHNSVAEWRTQFPFWSEDTIGRALKSLRSRGVVIAEQLSPDPRDRSMYYRIDYSALSEIDGTSAECTTASCVNGRSQSAAIPIKNRDYTENPLPPEGESLPAGFADFWKAYPRKAGKDAAISAWKRKVKSADTIKAIKTALDQQKQSDAWTKNSGRYVPNPSTWINQGRWKDDDEQGEAQPAWMEGVR
jgi:hypothetical protein